MLNKPINVYPHNCCADVSQGLQIQYEIPNNEKIDGRYVFVNDLENGETVASNRLNQEADPTNKIVCDIRTYYENPSYKIKNDKEYSWDSFYWQTPTKAPKNYVVGSIKDDKTILLKPEGGFISNVDYKHKRESINNGDCLYYHSTDVIFDEYIHNDIKTQAKNKDIDLIEHCEKGTISDYYGYYMFEMYWMDSSVGDSVMDGVRPGNCIFEVYKEDVLISRTRIIAWGKYGNYFYYIIDNNKFISELQVLGRESFYGNEMKDYGFGSQRFSLGSIKIFNSDELEKDDVKNGMLRVVSEDNRYSGYYIIKNSVFTEYYYEIALNHHLSKDGDGNLILSIGENVDIWDNQSVNFNTTPTYYFRTKTMPVVKVVGAPAIASSGGVNYIQDIKHRFKISYESDHSKLNYFYLYLYALNPQTNEWALKERSPMLYNPDEAYEFSGFIKGQKYKIYGVCTDNDGDEWDTAEVQFDVRYTIGSYKNSATFNKDLTTIDISFSQVLFTLSTYPDISLEVYKILKSDLGFVSGMDYVGGGLAKINNIICFDMLRDYNIKNDSCYDYYARVIKKKDGVESISFAYLSENVHTDFSGTSILGIEKISDTQLNIAKSFNLLYHFNKDIGELTNEMSREYINSFSRYPKELKGHQNYISGNCSGLLGSECNGIYEEPKGIRDSWKDFVNDDTIKFYRGIDGETMIISIESSKITPSYFPGVGIVNEVYIIFKELSSTKQYAVFSTEKQEIKK